MIKILVAEDDESLNKIVCSRLAQGGYEAAGFPDADRALAAMENERFDMIVTDIMMPGTDGFAFAAAVRAADAKIPVLFMTAKDDKVSKQRGYSLGIDDYIVKPFDLDELVMRVGAILRRAEIENAKKITAGNLTMDSEEHTAYLDGEELPLTVREFDILYRMLSYPKRTFTRAQLMDSFWGYDSSATSRTVDVYMAKLREKTAKCDGFELVTVHGLGYKAVLK